MSEILTERFGSVLRITLNRPAKKNAMTSSMYLSMAEILNDAEKDEEVRVVPWNSTGDSFSAGNDLEDFLKHPPGPGESARFQLPFVNLGLVPEFGSSWSLPARSGYIRAAELILLGQPFDAKVAAEIGLVTRVVPDEKLLATATETAEKLAAKPPGALQACKRLMKHSQREQIAQAIKVENEEFALRVRSAEAKEAFTAFLEKRAPDFKRTKEPAGAR